MEPFSEPYQKERIICEPDYDCCVCRPKDTVHSKRMSLLFCLRIRKVIEKSEISPIIQVLLVRDAFAQ